MDVLDAAWHAQGSPVPAGYRFTTRTNCARCGEHAATVDAHQVISGNWTGWDQWSTTTRARLCARCSWGYRDPVLRSGCYAITRAPATFTTLTYQNLGSLLAEPVGLDTCVVVPMRLMRKHLAPSARWGHVCVDDAALSWTSEDCTRLATMIKLRGWGFGSDMLSRPVPAYGPLSKLPPAQRAQAMALWADLMPWRQRMPWFEVGVRASMPVGDSHDQ
ncbi:hypothetical protein BIV57_02105 [Mangrovactinospora gilvigrisea]|uniref:Uncharacterized protein n=2 Tax=Mangrovactinospora gilvigrisea TaxID=1428644 RepID=A0A1J7BKE7_9ACTN|nr:hypothetical protein BIV57_02105 [Mangrovactinospora gilvigrisea]